MKTRVVLALGLWVYLNGRADQTSAPATADYGYFDGTSTRQRIVVIGASLAKDATKTNYCQTRTKSGNATSDWHDAYEVEWAGEDQYTFRAADNSDSAQTVETRVMGADGNYTGPVVVGDGSHYQERFLTSASPHDCLGTTIQVKWCREHKPQLGSKMCPDTKYALQCQKQNTFVIVGVHFAPGAVSRIDISFDYTQIDLRNLGDISDSTLRRAATSTPDCPSESSFQDVTNLNHSCPPAAIECSSTSDAVAPGTNDVAVFYMFKRKSWPAVLNINNIQIETIQNDISSEVGKN